MESNSKDIERRSSALCSSSSLTPETDAVVTMLKQNESPVEISVLIGHAMRMEAERDELAGYLCRIKLPLPVRFVADLAEVFPGKNVRMKDVDGYLCIFSENAEVRHGAKAADLD